MMKFCLISRGKLRHNWFASELDQLGVLAAHFVQSYQTSTEIRAEKSELMQRYFEIVAQNEIDVFSRQLGPASERFQTFEELTELLDDHKNTVPIVFGTSLIKGEPLQLLMSRNAINVHAGLSPEYKGSACNFWAVHDGKPDLAGVTLHRLTSKVDTGDIFLSYQPSASKLNFSDPSKFTMDVLRDGLSAISLFLRDTAEQYMFHDFNLGFRPIDISARTQLRTSRHSDFNDDVVSEHFKRWPSL